MPTNGITGMTSPDLSISNGTWLSFDASWNNTYDGAPEDRQFVYMDVVWFINGSQYESHHGDGERESDKYTMAAKRSSLYPYGMQVTKCFYEVRGVYPGAAKWGPFRRSPVLEIKRPDDPKVKLTATKAGDTNDVDWQVEVSAQDQVVSDVRGTRERMDTVVTVRLLDEAGKEVEWTGADGKKLRRFTDYLADTSPSEPYSGTMRNLLTGMSGRDYRRLVVTAVSRGVAGNSGTVTVERVFAHPSMATIRRAFTASIGKSQIVVTYDYAGWNLSRNPVDSARLEYATIDCDLGVESLVNKKWTTAATANNGGLDSQFCINHDGDWIPEQGKRTWFRIATVHDGLETFSVPVPFPEYTPKPTVEPGGCYILDAGSGDDGETVWADVLWQDDTALDIPAQDADKYEFTTQVTWADSQFAWQSTSDPGSHDFSWEDSPCKRPDEPPEAPDGIPAATWPSEWAKFTHSGRVYIRGLEEGELTFIRARRHAKGGDVDKLGSWSQIATATPVSAPAWARLSLPPYVARGESLPCTWTFGADVAQTGWTLTGSDGRGWGNGDDANGYHVIDAEALEGIDELELSVSVTTGGSWVTSDPVTTRIVDAPECSVSDVPDTLAALPLGMSVAATPGSDVSVTIVSRGISYATPSGMRFQYAGDVVWSGKGTGDLSVSEPVFVNGCTYDVMARAKDPETGLVSEYAVATFTAAFARRTGLPSATIAVDEGARSVAITPSAPSDAIDGDVCDVYRVTPDGAQLVASGIAFGSTVTDRFAPFCSRTSGESLSYRICRRAADGDEVWRDVPYEMRVGRLRLDWGTSHVELPYNVATSEAFSKAFESRTHMDGVTEGFWDEGATRSASLTTEMIRLNSSADRALVREMARYAGPVFVRTGSGLAFEADVQLSAMEESYESGAIEVSLGCTEIALTDEHRCGMQDVTLPEVTP